MKLKELLKVIPEEHIIKIYDEGDMLLNEGTRNDVESDYLNYEVKEIFGCTSYDDFENDDELDGTDILMVFINRDDTPCLSKINRELEKTILKNADLYDKKVNIDSLKLSTRLKHNLLRGNCITVGDILNRISNDERSICNIRCMGEKTYNELLTYLVEHCYELSIVES